jgi:cytosine/adenosine deaminase-related metal-dependent hydrolase/SAM-dependent methyltransferase
VPPGATLSAQDVYQLASRSYDTEPNAVLALERRFLEPLLPVMTGLDVVDLGCGTGRWLAALRSRSPRKLLGVDLSRGMLQVAKCKIARFANLVLADCATLPFPRASTDLILGSFLASYLPDVTIFAEQIRRILRPGGTVFLTDLHPTTAAKFGWRRGFRVAGTFLDVPTYAHSIQEILCIFQKLGLEADAVVEPHFGEPEMDVFQGAGKADAFHAVSGNPAIFILQLSLRRLRQGTSKKLSPSRMVRQLVGARVALGTRETVRADIRIDSGRIQFLGHRPDSAAERATREHSIRSFDLSGYLLLPGLINAHDHLEFALFPRLGKGGYRNFVEWADDIHRPGASPVREHRAVPKKTRLWWGGIRNLLAGVTTVCHHNPYVAEVFDRGFAVRVLRDFRWAHSLQMGQQALARPENRKCNQPFIMHVAEGVDPQSADEIFRLSDQRTLDDRTVIVHGLGLDAKGRAFLNSAGASLVWCPTSNAFLFGRTHDRETINSFAKVALGSDSPLTADGDLLDEVRFAHEAIGLSAEDLYRFVTIHPAEALRLRAAEGTIRVGGVADFVAVRDTGLSPAQTLVGLSFRDVELVVIGGYIHLASPDIYERLPRVMRASLHPLEVDSPLKVDGPSEASRSSQVNRTIRWIRAPLTRLIADAKAHLPGDLYLGGKRVRHALSA